MKVIDDLVPLHHIPVSVDLPEKIHRVYQIPSGDAIPFKRRKGKVELIVPELLCHTALVFQ